MKKKKALFVTFEGTEGAGKSTLIRLLRERLEKMGETVTVTREPGGSPVAERIRSVILELEMDPWTELFLYEASRSEHLARTLKPAIDAGHIVLCDRFADSSLAYQAQARGLPWKTVKTLNTIATRGQWPALTVLMDIDPEQGLRRASDPNRFELEGVAFQKKVRQGFLKALREEPRRWHRLKVGQRTPDDLADEVMKVILAKLKKIRK